MSSYLFLLILVYRWHTTQPSLEGKCPIKDVAAEYLVGNDAGNDVERYELAGAALFKEAHPEQQREERPQAPVGNLLTTFPQKIGAFHAFDGPLPKLEQQHPHQHGAGEPHEHAINAVRALAQQVEV